MADRYSPLPGEGLPSPDSSTSPPFPSEYAPARRSPLDRARRWWAANVKLRLLQPADEPPPSGYLTLIPLSGVARLATHAGRGTALHPPPRQTVQPLRAAWQARPGRAYRGQPAPWQSLTGQPCAARTAHCPAAATLPSLLCPPTLCCRLAPPAAQHPLHRALPAGLCTGRGGVGVHAGPALRQRWGALGPRRSHELVGGVGRGGASAAENDRNGLDKKREGQKHNRVDRAT